MTQEPPRHPGQSGFPAPTWASPAAGGVRKTRWRDQGPWVQGTLPGKTPTPENLTQGMPFSFLLAEGGVFTQGTGRAINFHKAAETPGKSALSRCGLEQVASVPSSGKWG